jgi:penicillin V acylase-like amidase (Ntn superfamily)
MLGGEQQVYDDLNDGKDGFGVMTNEPEYPWHVRAVQHYEWKQTCARSATVGP